ncbi:hypothetical protein [Pseudomonas asplenii]|nr:hypothetical protein [Pseudomonas fuscovaginae]
MISVVVDEPIRGGKCPVQFIEEALQQIHALYSLGVKMKKPQQVLRLGEL